MPCARRPGSAVCRKLKLILSKFQVRVDIAVVVTFEVQVWFWVGNRCLLLQQLELIVGSFMQRLEGLGVGRTDV